MKFSVIRSLVFGFLLTVCGITYFFISEASPTPPSNKNGNEHTSSAILKSSGFKNEVLHLLGRVLPNRQQNDEVPFHLQLSSGKFETNIYRSEKNPKFEIISKKIFSGWMAKIQLIPIKKFNLFSTLLLISILILLIVDWKLSSRWTAAFGLSSISALSIFISIRLSQGWDEFFINLRHAYMLLHHGVYSINAQSMVEGTVDFIPLLATTILGWLGVDIINSLIVVSLLGNILVVAFSYLLVKKLTLNRTWGLIAALLAGLYPNVIWIGATGFSAVFFSGWILAASYFILFTDRRLLGLILLSILTLVRVEGIFFATLLIFYFYVVKPFPEILHTGKWKSAIKQGLINGFIVIAPFIFSLLVRYLVFGNAIPNPISFKNSNFDYSFFLSGINRLKEMIINHDVHLIFILMVILLITNTKAWPRNNKFKIWRNGFREMLALNILALLFIFPYYLGGGDWFPGYWNRYGLPFNLVFFLTFIILLQGVFFIGLKKRISLTIMFIFCFAHLVGYKKLGQFRQNHYIYSTLSALGYTDNRWQRIDHLATLGLFLDDVLPEDAVVASPEEATIMYFSKREMLGLLGVSNPDMTKMPFQPMNPGDIIHRRRGYSSVFKNRPDVLVLYEPVVVRDFPASPNLIGKIHIALQNDIFNNGMVDIAYYRVGSFKALEKMGYRHVTLSYPDRVFSLFVYKRIYEEFLKNLIVLNFKHLGSDSISFSVSPYLTKKYVPGVKELMNK